MNTTANNVNMSLYLRSTQLKGNNISAASILNMKTLQLLLVIATTVVARPIGNNCTTEFQSLLDKALEIKEHCNIKGFYDCCEVR